MVGRKRFIACALLVGLCSSSAGAKTRAFSGQSFLDADAGVVLRIEPGGLVDWLARASKSSPALGALKGGLAAGSRFALGHDLSTQAGMKAAGLDPTKPAWVQLGAIDADRADKVFERLASAKDWGPKFLRTTDRVFWRSRAVFAIRQRKKARALAKKIVALSGDAVVLNTKAGPQLALLFGERTKSGPSIRASLAREGVVSVGWSKQLGAYVMARVTKRALIVDVIGTYAGVPLMWRRDRKRFLAAIKTTKKSRFELLQISGAREELKSGTLVLWTDASALTDRFRLLDQTETLRQIAVALPQSRRAAKRRLVATELACKQMERLAKAGDLGDFALAFADQASGSEVAFHWGIRADSSYLQGLKFYDDGLRQAQGAFSLGVFLASWKPFLAAKRSGLIATKRAGTVSGDFAATRRALRKCPGGSTSSLLLFGWPTLFAQFLDDLAATSPRAAELTGAARNFSFSVQDFGTGLDSMKAFAEVSLARKHMASVVALLDNVFGKSEQSLDLSLWGNGRLVPFRPRVRGRDRLGVALGRRSVPVYRQAKSRTAKLASSALRFTGDAQALGARLKSLPMGSALGDLLAAYRSVDGELAIGGRHIRLQCEFKR